MRLGYLSLQQWVNSETRIADGVEVQIQDYEDSYQIQHDQECVARSRRDARILSALIDRLEELDVCIAVRPKPTGWLKFVPSFLRPWRPWEAVELSLAQKEGRRLKRDMISPGY